MTIRDDIQLAVASGVPEAALDAVRALTPTADPMQQERLALMIFDACKPSLDSIKTAARGGTSRVAVHYGLGSKIDALTADTVLFRSGLGLGIIRPVGKPVAAA